MNTIRSICALVVHNGWNVHQLDIKTAFLNSDLHEGGVCNAASRFCSKRAGNMVWMLKKALYGLKQAPRA